MKLKFKIFFSILSFLLAIPNFAQELSDKQIGFDFNQFTEQLQKKGLGKDEIREAIFSQFDFEKCKSRIEKSYRSNLKIDADVFSERSMMLTVPQIEKDALQALFIATRGNNWTNKLGWYFNQEVSNSWFGITVSNGHVVAINLSDNNLIGTLPPEIGNLLFLQRLDLYRNNLSGSLPTQIGLLQNLKYLDISLNTYQTAIPSQIGNLSSLEYLNLSQNYFIGSIPLQIGLLTNLQFLYLNNNNLTGSIPVEIGNLINLKALTINYNLNFSGNIPSVIGSLVNLEGLSLGDTQISGNIPVELYNCTKLINLTLDPIYLGGTLSPQIGQLTNLEYLRIDSRGGVHGNVNAMYGNLPVQISNLIKLKSIWLTYNNFSGLLPSLVQLNDLESLYITANLFEGKISLSNNFLNIFNFFQVSKNKFRFNDFPNNLAAISSKYFNDPYDVYYKPQAKTDLIEAKSVAVGGSVTLKMSDDAIGSYIRYTSQDTFQWYKKNMGSYVENLLIGKTSRDLTIPNATAADAGVYTCKSINANVAGLELVREPITLTVTPAPAPCITATNATLSTQAGVFCVGATGATINFTQNINVPQNLDVTSTWTFLSTAGTVLSTQQTTGKVSTRSYTYPSAGTYVVNVVSSTFGCANITKSITVVITAPIVPTFTQVAPICSGATLSALPTSSTNTPAITGTWSPALNNLATTTYTFTPTAGLCANTATITITVTPKVTPTFTQVAPICSGATLASLPTTSTNGITGTWLPALNNTATTTYTFTPNVGQCATIVTMTIIVNPKVTPTFNQVAGICVGGLLSSMPTISLNGIVGTWSPALNNTATTTYTFTPNNGLCATVATMTISVSSGIVPLFTQVAPICSGAILAALPTISNNKRSISGTWSPVLNNTATTTYTFTPNIGQCATTTTMTIIVNPKVTPTFNQVAGICVGGLLSSLPTTSLNGIVGTWSPALNNTATTTYTFTPNNGLCATVATMTISISSGIVPLFIQVAPICSGAILAALPTISNNKRSISGTWSPALNNTATTTYTFTPNVGQCATTTTMTIIVNPKFIPTFNQVGAICSGAILAALPTTSLNVIIGTWSPALNNTATTTYTFTPTTGQCATIATMTIIVNPKVTPTFAQFGAICSGTILPALPTTSTNRVTGTWSPALNNLVTTTYTFTPTAGQCATITTMTITVRPIVIPIFNQVAGICVGGILAELPTMSLNGIEGIWTPAINNTVGTNYTFTSTNSKCESTTSMFIKVDPKITPTFKQVSPVCNGDVLGALSTTSTNGVTGTWLPALNNTATTTYTFTPTAGVCASTAIMTITIIPRVTPTFNQVNGICAGGILSPLPTTSINGIIGIWIPAINNLVGTSYIFTPASGQCAFETKMFIKVDPVKIPTFRQVAPICSGSTLIPLPTTSINGVTGTWSPALNNTATTTYIFTPTSAVCASTASMTITVNTCCVPYNVSVTPTATSPAGYCTGVPITFVGLVANPNPAEHWNSVWTFYDTNGTTVLYTQSFPNSPAVSGSVPMTYANAGLYTVKVVLTRLNGCPLTTITSSVKVVDCCPTFNGSLTATSSTGVLTTNAPITFSGTLNTTSTEAITSVWTLYDTNGTTVLYTDTRTGSALTPGTATWTYPNPGTYTAKIVTTRKNGCPDNILTVTFTIIQPSCTQTNLLAQSVKTKFIALMNDIIANINVVPIDNVFAANSSAFQALKPYITDPNPGIYNFYFGGENDLRFSFGDHPTYDVNGHQMYFGYLTNIDLSSFVDSNSYLSGYAGSNIFSFQNGEAKSFEVRHINFCPKIQCAPIAGNIKYNDIEICTNKEIQFNFSTANNTGLTYVWSFLNPAGNPLYTSTLAQPTMTFPSTGAYVITLTVTDTKGCETKFKIPFEVKNACEPCIKTNPNFENIRGKFIALLTHLSTLTTVPNGYVCPELSLLAPFITDANPAIYNFSKLTSQLKFNFSNHPSADYDVIVGGDFNALSDIFLVDYYSSQIGSLIYDKSTQGGKIKGSVKHINFCSTTDCKSVFGDLKSYTQQFCTGADLNFGLNTLSTNLSFNWNFTYLPTNTVIYAIVNQLQPAIIVNLPLVGEYRVILTVKDPLGCTTTFIKIFTVTEFCKSCTTKNPIAVSFIKQKFVNLVNHLANTTSVIADGYNCPELTSLSPYITDKYPAIFDFVKTPTRISFSFNKHGIIKDIEIPIIAGNPITDLNLDNYFWSEISAEVYVVYKDGNKAQAKIRHINFCSNNICDDTVGQINTNSTSTTGSFCLGKPYKLIFVTNNSVTKYNWAFMNLSTMSGFQTSEEQTLNVNFSVAGYYIFVLTVTNKYDCQTTFYKYINVESCPDSPIICKVHFDFNFNLPSEQFGGLINDTSRENIANGIINFTNSKQGEQLEITSYDMQYNEPRATSQQYNYSTQIAPAFTNSFSETQGGINGSFLKISPFPTNDVFFKTINFFGYNNNNNNGWGWWNSNNNNIRNNGILQNNYVNDINVSFFVISNDQFQNTTQLTTAYNMLKATVGGKAKKIFFVLIEGGKFKNSLTGATLNPIEFLKTLKGSMPVEYIGASPFVSSDYVMFKPQDIFPRNFTSTFKDLLDKIYQSIKPDSCPVAQCLDQKPNNTAEVKYRFVQLINKLRTNPPTTSPYPTNPLAPLPPERFNEAVALVHYMPNCPPSDFDIKIYNYTNDGTNISFSFTNQTVAQDVVMAVNNGAGDITSFNFNTYTNENAYGTFTAFYSNGTTTTNNKIKSIKFCPDELYCQHHVAIVVDESGSISSNEENDEVAKIKSQLKSFIKKQLSDNEKLGTNMCVSLIGLSDQDIYNRKDGVIALSTLSNGTQVLTKVKDDGVDRNISNYLNWITSYKKRYNKTPKLPGVSPNSDYWASGLQKALDLKAEMVVLITDGCQTSDLTGNTLKTLMRNFGNSKNPNSNPNKPRLFVIGIENGFYVDKDLSARPALTPLTDPNRLIDEPNGNIELDAAFEKNISNEEVETSDNKISEVLNETLTGTSDKNQVVSKESTNFNSGEVANKITPFLSKSLKFLLDYNDPFAPVSEFPKRLSEIDYLSGKSFFENDYVGLNDFGLIGNSQNPNFISNGLTTVSVIGKGISCGDQLFLKNCDECEGFQPSVGKDYILSAWVKEEINQQVPNYENARIKLVFRDEGKLVIPMLKTSVSMNNNDFESQDDLSGSSLSTLKLPCVTTGEIIDGWQRIFKKFTVPLRTVYFDIELTSKKDSTNPVYFDDIRVHPADGTMKSFVYDSQTYKLMAEMDENNFSTFYEYDNEGGLIRIKKETERGVKTIQETRSGSVIKKP